MDLLVLPEFFSTGYQFMDRQEAIDLAEEIPGGPTCRKLADLCGAAGGTIVAGMAERAGTRVFNSARGHGPYGRPGHLSQGAPVREEKTIFDPGEEGFRVYPCAGARLGVMVCFDWAFRRRPGPWRSRGPTSSATRRTSFYVLPAEHDRAGDREPGLHGGVQPHRL